MKKPTAGKRQNNFDTIRIVAAMAVLISHSVPLTYGSDKSEIVWRISHGQTTAGGIAVDAFFAISGYLITASFVRSYRNSEFLLGRALRIFPGLCVALLLVAGLLGPCLSDYSLKVYFHSLLPYRYVGLNLCLHPVDGLPGLFVHNPFPDIINGSLWTLRYEAECYILIFFMGNLNILNRRGITALYAISLVGSAFWVSGMRFVLMSVFLGGATIYIWDFKFNGRVSLVFLIVWISSALTTGERLAAATCGAYVILYLALSHHLQMPKLARWGDLSYGIYIYAFPIQQTVRLLSGSATTWYWNVIFSTPIVIFFAFLSWHLIESPSLALKYKLREMSLSNAVEASVEEGRQV